MTDGSPRPGTTADIAHRLDTLEAGHAALVGVVNKVVETQQQQGTDLQLIRQAQDYNGKLTEARFTTLENLANGANAKIDQLTVYLQGLVTEAGKAQADWKSTPAGRELVDDLAELRAGREANANRIAQIEKRQYAMTIVLAVVVVVANLVAPTVIGALSK